MDDQERELAAATEAELKEDELELSLGLRPAPSIGRNFHLSKPKSPVPEGTGDLSLSVSIWGKGGAGSDLDSEGLGFEKEAKREAQALRRHEARKKREEKRKLKANAFSGNSNGDDFSKRRRTGDQRYCANNGFEGAPLVPVPVPVTTSFMVRPQGRVNGNQFNGLPYYMVMPGLVGGDGSALQPATVAAAGFRPYLVAEKNSGDGSARVDNAKHSVSGCSRGSSPGVSDHRSSSGQGRSSSDGGSASSQSRPQAPMTTNGPITANGKAEGSSSSCQIEPIQTLKTTPNPVEVATNSSKTKSCHIERNSSLQSETSPSKKPSLLPTHTNEATSVVNPSKPLKPPAQKSSEAVLLSEMPYVSTTGNGPNGKTITGFLYKYTQSEVCIVCVCHGSFLTLAGFVEHAGGVDVDNPLRHITVVPFTFT